MIRHTVTASVALLACALMNSAAHAQLDEGPYDSYNYQNYYNYDYPSDGYNDYYGHPGGSETPTPPDLGTPVNITVLANAPTTVNGVNVRLGDSRATLDLSDNAMGFIDVIAAQPSAPSGGATLIATMQSKNRHDSIAYQMPVLSASGRIDLAGGTFDTTNLTTGGVIQLTAPQRRFSATGGSLTFSNFDIDMATKTVFVDVGASNVAVAGTHQALWTFDQVSGPGLTIGALPTLASCGSDICASTLSASLTLSGLRLTSTGTALFTQGFGLTVAGRAALGAVDDFGTLSVSSVPEPSSWAMLLTGMLGVGLGLNRRRRATTH